MLYNVQNAESLYNVQREDYSALIRKETLILGVTCVKSLQSYPTLHNLKDCSSPGSSVHGILQARILKWVAMPSSRGSSWPRDQTCISYVSSLGRQLFTTSTNMGEPPKHYVKWNKLGQKDKYYMTYIILLYDIYHQILSQKVEWWLPEWSLSFCQGLGQTGMGSQCLTGTEF